MVCDGAVVASTVASVMMNGLCCAWQMDQEKELRVGVREDVRREYERQRAYEAQVWERRQQAMEGRLYASDSSRQDERRRRFRQSKLEALAKARQVSKTSPSVQLDLPLLSPKEYREPPSPPRSADKLSRWRRTQSAQPALEELTELQTARLRLFGIAPGDCLVHAEEAKEEVESLVDVSLH